VRATAHRPAGPFELTVLCILHPGASSHSELVLPEQGSKTQRLACNCIRQSPPPRTDAGKP
jgi:hypothetical protein